VSNSQYHDRTLELLDEHWSTPHSIAKLRDWARANEVSFESIPAAYLQWCRFDGSGERLRKFSNMDKFFLLEPRPSELEDHSPLLCFKSENQDNYRLAVPLVESGEPADPPVYFSWVHAPWTLYCDSFSEYVFTQIFDHQHAIDADEPFLGYLKLDFDLAALDVLKRSLKRAPTTRFAIDGVDYTEHRFFRKPSQRIKATLVPKKPAFELFITCDDRRLGELFRDAWAERISRFGA
jgi:hypothetical protein